MESLVSLAAFIVLMGILMVVPDPAISAGRA